MERGQKYHQPCARSVGQSLPCGPENPRAKVLKLQNDMGAARFFGKDPKEYCAQVNELFAKWDEYKIKSPLYPAWGKDQAAQLVEQCKVKE